MQHLFAFYTFSGGVRTPVTTRSTPVKSRTPERIRTGPRIGIDYAQEAAEFPWRFWFQPEEGEDHAVF